jgi:hypothetical protein
MDGKLTKQDLIQRMRSDAQLPENAKVADLKVSDSDVDKEIESLKTHAVVAEAMSAPITRASASAAVSARLRELASQLSTLATDLAPSVGVNIPNGLESFIGW